MTPTMAMPTTPPTTPIIIPKLESPEPEPELEPEVDGAVITGADTTRLVGKLDTAIPSSDAVDWMLANKAALPKVFALCTAADASAGATVAINVTMTARLLADAADEETEFPLL